MSIEQMSITFVKGITKSLKYLLTPMSITLSFRTFDADLTHKQYANRIKTPLF